MHSTNHLVCNAYIVTNPLTLLMRTTRQDGLDFRFDFKEKMSGGPKWLMIARQSR